MAWGVALAAAGFAVAALASPEAAIAAAFLPALLIFLANTALKAASLTTMLRHDASGGPPQPGAWPSATGALPVVSVIVPLYREPEIAASLLARLARLDYPRERLDVLLAVEEDDTMTRSALASARLPGWMRVVTVPDGHPRTKPRALNFALNFARGEIVGIYDAEDRPEADQILRVARRFGQLGPDTACLQGRLDYYNADHNLLSRLFAIEYATWFRVLLPGVERMGLVVPLGGTTLFLRRAALEAVGGWDAHNVTEDAELGLRLARHGYRTAIIDTTTYEEANAAVLPWIRQRTRWQKGYLLTWAMAMRSPRALWRDLGALRTIALQVQILFAVAGFLVAPLIWSLAVKLFGAPHPLDPVLGPAGYGALASAFAVSICLSVAIALRATRAPHLRRLRPWILLSEIYFMLAVISAWRAAAEMLLRPFWWAKTRHGGFGGVADPPPVGSARRRTHAVSGGIAPVPLPSVAPRRRSTGGP
jgi:cellulose synthase/poly-beta-1,6-N-acetylglucosamine synthase-like glycosyltransferase